MAKQKLEQFNTSIGVASYPYLTNPDTKFVPEGEYSVKLILSESEAAPLLKLIDEHMESAFQTAKSEQKGTAAKKKVKMADPPYVTVEDEEGDETGEMRFSFKQKAVIKSKKTGKTFTKKPVLFDAKLNPVVLKGFVGSGSRIRVNFNIIPFFTKLIGAGVSLRLRAVQIVELVESGLTAEACGFEEEDGFEGTPLEEVAEDAPFTKDDDTSDF